MGKSAGNRYFLGVSRVSRVPRSFSRGVQVDAVPRKTTSPVLGSTQKLFPAGCSSQPGGVGFLRTRRDCRMQIGMFLQAIGVPPNHPL